MMKKRIYIKKKIYIKNRQLLKNFFVLLAVLLGIIFLVTGCLYHMMFQTLQQEIKGVNEATACEMTNRMEEALEKCREIAVGLSLSEYSQLYFISPEPGDFRKNYYVGLSGELKMQGLTYIDSIILYASEYAKMYDSKTGLEYFLSEGQDTSASENVCDLSWMKEYEEGDPSMGGFFTRARAGKWPYYLTYMLRWQSGEKSGAILVNVDLEKLYDYLLMERSKSVKLYAVDDEQRIFLKENMTQLYMSLQEVEKLKTFRTGESYCELNRVKDQAYTYVQRYMEEYGFTCVTVSPVGDYFVRLTQLQTRFFGAILIAAILAITMACVYSVKLVEPHQDNAVLRQELEHRQDLLRNSQLLALQTQINPHFLFNTLNIASLMIESEQGEEYPVTRILSGLSDILRYSLNKNINVRVREEIACVEKYIFIMKYRYGEFEIRIDVDEKIQNYSIPKFILQPLVENALQHGILPCMDTRPGSIKIQISEIPYTYKNGKELMSVCVDVMDNGLGVDEEKLEELRKSMNDHENIFKNHIGLFNVSERFYLLFHEEQEVIIESTFGMGTHVKLVFPVKE